MRTLSLLSVCVLSFLGFRTQDPPAAVAAGKQGAVQRAAVVLTGKDSAVTKGSFHRVQEPQELARLWLLHRGIEAPTGEYGFFYNDAGVPEVDFESYEVLVMFDGETINSAGFVVLSVADEPGRRVVRYDDKGFSTEGPGPDGGAQRTRPFGFFVLPRTKLPLVLEQNVQHERDRPPVWKEQARL